MNDPTPLPKPYNEALAIATAVQERLAKLLQVLDSETLASSLALNDLAGFDLTSPLPTPIRREKVEEIGLDIVAEAIVIQLEEMARSIGVAQVIAAMLVDRLKPPDEDMPS